MLFRPGAWPWRTLFVVLLIAIVYLALSPRPPQTVDTGWDKLNHVLAFAALAWVGTFSGAATLRWMGVLALGLLAFGGAIEVAQSFVPDRAGEWADLGADTLGMLVGFCLALPWRARMPSPSLSR